MVHTAIIAFLLIGAMFFFKEYANKETTKTSEKVETISSDEDTKNDKHLNKSHIKESITGNEITLKGHAKTALVHSEKEPIKEHQSDEKSSIDNDIGIELNKAIKETSFKTYYEGKAVSTVSSSDSHELIEEVKDKTIVIHKKIKLNREKIVSKKDGLDLNPIGDTEFKTHYLKEGIVIANVELNSSKENLVSTTPLETKKEQTPKEEKISKEVETPEEAPIPQEELVIKDIDIGLELNKGAKNTIFKTYYKRDENSTVNVLEAVDIPTKADSTSVVMKKDVNSSVEVKEAVTPVKASEPVKAEKVIDVPTKADSTPVVIKKDTNSTVDVKEVITTPIKVSEPVKAEKAIDVPTKADSTPVVMKKDVNSTVEVKEAVTPVKASEPVKAEKAIDVPTKADSTPVESTKDKVESIQPIQTISTSNIIVPKVDVKLNEVKSTVVSVQNIPIPAIPAIPKLKTTYTTPPKPIKVKSMEEFAENSHLRGSLKDARNINSEVLSANKSLQKELSVKREKEEKLQLKLNELKVTKAEKVSKEEYIIQNQKIESLLSSQNSLKENLNKEIEKKKELEVKIANMVTIAKEASEQAKAEAELETKRMSVLQSEKKELEAKILNMLTIAKNATVQAEAEDILESKKLSALETEKKELEAKITNMLTIAKEATTKVQVEEGLESKKLSALE
ncbi:MAG: hypothetical protein DSZ07_02665, partial [Sulfurovum sp.]